MLFLIFIEYEKQQNSQFPTPNQKQLTISSKSLKEMPLDSGK
ncbi:hypothetical protein SSUST3_0465 [Streptococcus suis ST3]|nr:hypothetical protein SSUST3_0465 [Streptococcus suis ST3]AER16706.1 hypothetical protein SSUD9_0461 [Streptococcus suis D9]AGW86831.1 hypothetical protein YB51_2295 [Streptococcus suis YB51]